jgi:hypothetical protein
MPYRRPKRLRAKRRPTLHIGDILAWADAHRERTGRFPNRDSGAIGDASGETWTAVDVGLKAGRRGLPGGSSLARLLAERRGARNRTSICQLSVNGILQWVDRHKARTGLWPRNTSGPVAESPGDSWNAIDRALRSGGRGVGGRS